jgi:hypothetical protein
MSFYHPGPWWAKDSPYGSTLILDIHGRKLAEVFHDIDRPDMTRGTLALAQHAPSLYRSLRFITDLLEIQGRTDLAQHLQRTLSLVEPEPKPVEIKLSA